MAKSIDYKSFKENGKKKHETPKDSYQKRWWLASDSDMPDAVVATIKMLADFSKERQRQYQYSVSNRLYGNQDLMGVTGLSTTKMADLSSGTRNRITYNVVQSALDTLAAKITKNKPKPMFLTSGGNYKLQKQAKKLEKFVDGVFYENKVYTEAGRRSFLDAGIFGDGMVKVYAKDGRVCIERRNPRQIYTDWIESINKNPRQKFETQLVDRDVLIDCYPEHADKIRASSGASLDAIGLYSSTADQILVIEAWHLPSGDGATDGKHVMCIDTVCLINETWDKQFFPFAKLPFNERTEGYWSQGGAEQIQGNQLEINKIMWRISRSLDLGSTFKVWIKNGSKIVKEHINNEIGTIINSDEPPQYLIPPIVQPEIYARLKETKNEAFELIGVSQLSAQSQKPAGLDSGKALRTYNNIETERFITIGRAYEQMFLDLAFLVIDCAQDIVAEYGSLKVKAPNSKVLDDIDFKDIKLKDEDYILKMYPTSSLPTDPEGRLQSIQERVQAGMMTPRQASRLLDFPDDEAWGALNSAREDWLHECFENIIYEGKFTAPEPEDDLQLAQTMFLDYYAFAKASNVEDKKLQMLIQFNDQTKDLIMKAMPPPPPAPMDAAGGVVQAVGQPAPQSDLLPMG
jgi:hypothetical protein